MEASSKTASSGASGTRVVSTSPSKDNSVAALLRSFEGAVFGVMELMQRKHATHRYWAAFSFFVAFLQLCAFALAPHAHYTWHESTITPIQIVSKVTTVPGLLDVLSASSYQGLYYFAVAWVAAFVGLFLWASVCFMRHSWPVMWPLHILSVVGTTSATVLYIPVFYLLMSGFTCHLPEENPYWQQARRGCSDGGHIAQIAITAVLLMLFVALSSLFTLVYFNHNPFSANVAAKAHGRCEFIHLLVVTVLVSLVEVFPNSVGADILCAVNMVAGLALVAVYAWMMPFTHHKMNKLMLGLVSTYTWLSVCLVIAQAYPGFDAAVMLYVGAPVAAVAGSSIADRRAKRVSQEDMSSARSVYEVELKVRYFLHSALYGHATDESRGIFATAATDVEAGSSQPGKTTAAKMVANFGDEDGADDRAAYGEQVRTLLPDSVVKSAEAMLKTGLKHYKTSALLHIFAARFYSKYCRNQHLQMSHLVRAEQCNPAVDVRFLVSQARKHADHNAGQTNALNRLAFEGRMNDARRHTKMALQRQVAFWGELSDDQPDVTRCHRLCAEMNDAITAAEAAFGLLLELNGQSLLVLRLYAEFTLYVVNNQEKAAIILAEADRIEEQQAKDHQREASVAIRFMEPSDLDMLSDNTAVVTIGASPSNFGLILSVSSYTSKLFGYSRWQLLERRNISMLLPQPIASFHDDFLRKYMETGAGDMVGQTRVVLGLHRSGHIFPMLLNVREQPASDGPPAFIGVMRAINTTENHILLNSQFVVTGASLASLALLDLEASALVTSECKITDWVHNWEAVLPDLKKPKGTTVHFQGLIDRRSQNSPGGTPSGGSSPAAGRPMLDDGESNSAAQWVRGHLQQTTLSNGESVYVLHWVRVASDSHTGVRSETIRRQSVKSLRGTGSPARAIKDVDTSAEVARTSSDRLVTRNMRLPPGHASVGASANSRGCPAMLATGMFDNMNVDTSSVGKVGGSAGMSSAKLVKPVQSGSSDPSSRASSHPFEATRASQWSNVSMHTTTAAPPVSNAEAALVKSSEDAETAGHETRPSTAGHATTPVSAVTKLQARECLSDALLSDAYPLADSESPSSIINSLPKATRRRSSLSVAVQPHEMNDLHDAALASARHSSELEAVQDQLEAIQVRGPGGGREDAHDSTALLQASTGVLMSPTGIVQHSEGTPWGAAKDDASSVDVEDGDSLQGRSYSAVDLHGDRLGQGQRYLPLTNLNGSADGSVDGPPAVLYGGTPTFQQSEVIIRTNSNVNFSDGGLGASEALDRPTRSALASTNNGNGATNGGGVGGDRGSYASSHRSIGTKLQDRLRRVIEEGSKHLVPGLGLLRLTGIAILLIAAALGIGVSVFVSQEMKLYALTDSGDDVAPQLLMKAVYATRFVGNLVLSQRAWLPSDAASVAGLRAGLVTSTLAFRDLHQKLYSISQQVGYQDSYDLPTVPLLNFEFFPAINTVVPTQQNTSLSAAGLKFVAEAMRIAAAPLASISNTNPLVLFVAGNGFKGGSINTALNATIFDWLGRTNTVVATVSQTSLSVYGSMLSLVFILGLLVVLPILVYVDRTRDTYLLPFIALPALIPAKLRSHAEKRLLRLRASEVEHDEGDSSDDADDIDDMDSTDGNEKISARGRVTDWVALLASDTASETKKLSRSTMASAGNQVEAPSGRVGSIKGTRARKYRKSARSVLELAARFIFPFLLVAGFFTVIHFQTIQTLSQGSVTQQYGVVAHQRTIELAETPILLSQLVVAPGGPVQTAPFLAKLQSMIDSLVYHHTLLTFVGTPAEALVARVADPNSGISGALAAGDTGQIDLALYGNLCLYLVNVVPGFDYDACVAFRSGVLTHGLHGALDDFLTLIRRVSSRRAAAIVAATAVRGAGIMVVGGVTLPYSSAGELNSTDLLDVHSFSNLYLVPASSHLADIYYASTKRTLHAMSSFLVGFVTCFIIVFTAFQVFVYLPQVRRTNNEIKGERVMILLLPADVLHSVAPLQVMVQGLLESEEAKIA